MLEGLDQIDWHSLTHGGGPADSVPIILRDLASEDTQLQKKAIEALFGTIYHQGTIYEVTAYAVPFLIDLLQAKHITVKKEILLLLGHIATGNSYWDVHQHLSFVDGITKQPGFSETLEKELGWVKSTRLAVQMGIELYARLLAHHDSEVRGAAAFTIAWFKENARSTGPKVFGAAQNEKDETALVNMILCLGALDQAESFVLDYLMTYIKSGRTELVETAAAISICHLVKDATPTQVVEVIADSIRPSDSMAEFYRNLYWFPAGLSDVAGSLLCAFDIEKVRFLIPKLLETLEIANEYQAANIVFTLMYLAFNGKPAQPDLATRDLTEDQKIALSALLQLADIWNNFDVSGIPFKFGLPPTVDGIERLLGGENHNE